MNWRYIVTPLVLGQALQLALGYVFAADVAVESVQYASGAGRLEVTLRLRDAANLAPLEVTAMDEATGRRVTQTIAKATGKQATCYLKWPLAPLGSRILIRVEAKGRVQEGDLTNNQTVVTMRQAVNLHYKLFYQGVVIPEGLDVKRLPSTVYEAEDFPVQQDVKVEAAKGASGGKAVRLLTHKSRIVREVELEAGVYVFYAVAMAFAGDQDALNVTLAGTKQRGHLSGLRKWVAQDQYGIVRVKQGKHTLTVYFDEPQVLCDKVVVAKVR